MRTVAWIGVMALVLLLCSSALAEQGKIGLGAKVGYHNFIRYSQVDDPDNDGVLEDGEIDYAIDSGAFDGVTVETDFEYAFSPHFTLGGALQWYGTSVAVDAVAERCRVKGDYTISVTNLTITPRFVLPLDFVRLYTGAGLGLYWRIVNTDFTIYGQDATTSQSNTDSGATIGYHAMLGAEIAALDWLGIVLEDRFAFAHFKGGDPTTDLDDADYGGNSAFLGARFHF
ncbi:MAG TPA: outer membrane beta-barrel protein [bacterium]|nr:outer membrane beta-barrel protein [bacterium]